VFVVPHDCREIPRTRGFGGAVNPLSYPRPPVWILITMRIGFAPAAKRWRRRRQHEIRELGERRLLGSGALADLVVTASSREIPSALGVVRR
jgi:hypothetical protein